MNEKSARKLQLSRRIDGIHPAAAWSIRVASIVFALIVGGLLLLALGYSPLKAYGTIIDGSLGSKTFVRQTIKIAIPLLGCALAIAPCFKMHFWNIGAEGQITAGAIGATFFALKFGKTMPQLPLLLIMAVAAILCGGLWALIPAFFKAKWNTNETLFTLMMNYIIIGVVKWLQGGPWEAPPSGSQMIAQFAGNAKLPSVLGVHCGWIIVLVLTVLMFIYMRYTKHGYEIAVIGDSSNTARYAGMNVGRIMMRTMFLSGSISGLVGFIIVSGANHTLYDGVAGGVGFTAISVAWLAQLNPFAMIPAVFAADCDITVSTPAPDPVKVGALYQLPLGTVFTDPNGHALSFALKADYGDKVYIKDNTLQFTSAEAGEFRIGITATCTGGGSTEVTVPITVEAVEDGDKNQYGYDETDQASVTVYVTISSDGAPIIGKDDGGTILSHLEVKVPYFPLSLYGLDDFNRYHTENGSGSYTDNEIVQRPTLLHLYIYMLERYYLGVAEKDCGKGTSGLLEFTGSGEGVNDMLGGSYKDTLNALLISGSIRTYHGVWRMGT